MAAAHKNECPVAAGQVVIKSTENNPHFTQSADLLQAIKFVANSQATDALVSGVVLLCCMLMALAVGGVQ